MKPERWQQIEQLYHAALERAPDQRAAFLDEACAGDLTVRREVESLLAYDEQAQRFITTPPDEVAAEMLAEEQSHSLIGSSLGNYHILSLLGAGGMGEVYLAQDARLGRKVALKLLPSEFTQDSERVRRFKQEARAASALNHPNILTIHEIGETGHRHFIVSEFVEGQTLRALMQSGRLGISEATRVADQVAGALSAAHEAGIIHRDIKPENVMVRPDGLVKVLDFGLAKLMSEELTEADSQAQTKENLRTASGVVMGTVSYMSPEQARGQKIDARSDIFSLGVMLYEMLAGRRPFEGKTLGDVVAALVASDPAPLSQARPDVPPGLERTVSRCLEKEREARYQSVEELIAELKRLRVGGQREKAAARRRIGRAGARIEMWRRSVVAVIAAVIAGVMIVGLVYYLIWRRAATVQPAQIKSLAVLPLENLSGDPQQEYFADGMTDALIGDLAKIGALRVISRTSAMHYKGAKKSLPQIASELKVDAVIEGTVQRSGDRVRIRAQLIYAPTERQLWTETYERNLGDVLALQSEIARTITQEIQIKLTPQEQMRLASAHPVNPQAYDDYLRGRFYANRQNRADNETTIMMLERAVALDPTFAAAHAELALAYVWRFFLFTPEEKQWQEKAFVAVEKALSLDPDSAEAHLARGRLLWTPANHFPHEQAIQEYRRVLALNPNLDEAQNQLALVYNHIGAFDQALQELQKAVTINPTNTSAQFRIGQTLLFQGKYEQALTALRSIPKEGNPRVGYHRAMALLHLGRRDEAAAIAEEFIADYPEDADGGLLTCFQALLAALAVDEKKAEAKIRSAIEKGKGFGHFHHTAYDIACAYSLMKKAEPAIKWLQAAAEDGFPCYPLFENEPYLDNLRKDPRFTALMAKLKEQWEYYRTRL